MTVYLKMFSIRGYPVRGYKDGKELYILGKDITDLLDYSNSSSALKYKVEEEEKRRVDVYDALGHIKTVTMINKLGILYLVFKSKKGVAKELKEWIREDNEGDKKVPAIPFKIGTKNPLFYKQLMYQAQKEQENAKN